MINFYIKLLLKNNKHIKIYINFIFIFKMTNVQVTVGKAFKIINQNNDFNLNRILKLENVIKEQKNEIDKLKLDLNPYIKEINLLKNELEKTKNENLNLKKVINDIDLLKSKLEQKLFDEEKLKENLIQSNKKLQQQIELLTNKIFEMQNNLKFQNEEYFNLEKVKGRYEDQIIELTNKLDSLKLKYNTSENIINQKEKYIQMLINQNNNKSNKLKEFKENNKISNENFKKSKTYININSLDDKEKDNIIKNYELKIKKLERDNNNLIVRLRNLKK